MSRRHLAVQLSVRLRACVLVAGLLVATSPEVAGAATVPGDYSTIQAAINAVLSGALPNGTTIDVQAGTYFEALIVPPTARSFTIRGVSGPGSTIVDAGGLATVLTVYRATGQMTFQGLTLRNGGRLNLDGGGFAFIDSSPAVVNCVVESNAANAGGGGALSNSSATFTQVTIRNNTGATRAGGVLIAVGSRPVFTNVDIVDNAAGTGGPGVGNRGVGGGVQSLDSFPTFRNSRINRNRSKFAAGGIYHLGRFDAPGGTAVLVVEDTEIADNVTEAYSAAENPSEGGGMNIEDNSVARLTRVRVLRNRANTAGGLNAYRARYDLVDSVVEGNQAVARTDGGIPGGIGGGITGSSNNVGLPLRPASVLNLIRTLVRNNVGIIGGGIVATGDVNNLSAIVTLTDVVVDGNQAQNQGGGVLMNRANLTVTNSIILRNTVAGGGVPFGGGLLLTTFSSASITGSTIAQNTAGGYGGGIFMDDNSSLQMNGSRLYDNTAPASSGGGLFVGGNGNSSGTVQNSVIADNVGHQIVEYRPGPHPFLNYVNNVITPRTGNSDIYYGLGLVASTIGQFNAAPSGRASGNTSGVPQFAHFLAAPTVGMPSTLAWSVARATSVTVVGSPASASKTGTIDVAPTVRTTYNLTAVTPGGTLGIPPAPTIAVVVGGPPLLPSAPLNLTAVPSGAAIAVAWNPPLTGGPIARYILMAGRAPGVYDLGSTDVGAVTSLNVPMPNGVYYLKVAAENENGQGPSTAEVTVTLGSGASVPSAPRNLTATSSGSTLSVSWEAPATGGPVTRYILRAGRAPGVYDLGAFDVGAVTTVTGPVAAGIYYLQVVAENANGPGPAAPEVGVTVRGPEPPSAPLGLRGGAVNQTLSLSWQPPVSGGPVTTYILQAGSTPGNYELFNGSIGAATSIAGPVPNGTYYVRVSAVGPYGQGPFSSEIAVTVGPACASPPPVLSGSRNGNVATLSWTTPAGGPVTGYTLQLRSATPTATHLNFPVGLVNSVSGPLGPGSYVVRALARVACGVSGPSNDVTIVVP